MNISGISFSGTYRIKCKDLKQAEKIKKALPESIDFAQKGKDIIVMPSFRDNKARVLDLLKENTDIHDKNMHNVALETYKRISSIEPGQIVDTYR